MDSSVGIRLAVNADDAKKALVDVADTGDAQMKRWSKSADQAANDATAALVRYQRAVDKVSAISGSAPQGPTSFGQFDVAGALKRSADTAQQANDARAAAAAIRDQAIAEEQLAARVAAFKVQLDPAIAAQQRFDAEMAEARSLVSQGAISLDDYCARLRQVRPAADAVEAGHSRMSTSGMILQHVVRSTGDIFAAGLPPSMIFAEQIGRLGEAAAYAGGSMGRFGVFMSGPWGIAVTAGISLATTLASSMLHAGDAADKQKEATDALAEAVKRLAGEEESAVRATRAGMVADLQRAETQRAREVQTRRT